MSDLQIPPADLFSARSAPGVPDALPGREADTVGDARPEAAAGGRPTVSADVGKADLSDRRPHPTHAEALAELMADVRRLVRYAVENAELPPTVDVGALYRIQVKFQRGGEIDDHDFALLVGAYQALERRLGPVSAETLRATEIPDASHAIDEAVDRPPWLFWRRTEPVSAAGRYVRFLEDRTYVNIAIVLLMHLIHHVSGVDSVTGTAPAGVWWGLEILGLVAVYFIPFLYGALGADAYVLRETTRALRSREFDPRRIAENRSRFLLGALSGGMIVLFVSQEVVTNVGGPFDLGYAALGFIAGYSTDFLFNTIERILGAILPRQGEEPRREVRSQDRSYEEAAGHAQRLGGGLRKGDGEWNGQAGVGPTPRA